MMLLINLQEQLNGSEKSRMVTIHVIDNGGQWTHREWRVLKYLDVETKIFPNNTDFSEVKNVDGLVLSGGLCSARSGSESVTGTRHAGSGGNRHG